MLLHHHSDSAQRQFSQYRILLPELLGRDEHRLHLGHAIHFQLKCINLILIAHASVFFLKKCVRQQYVMKLVLWNPQNAQIVFLHRVHTELESTWIYLNFSEGA